MTWELVAQILVVTWFAVLPVFAIVFSGAATIRRTPRTKLVKVARVDPEEVPEPKPTKSRNGNAN